MVEINHLCPMTCGLCGPNGKIMCKVVEINHLCPMTCGMCGANGRIVWLNKTIQMLCNSQLATDNLKIV